MSVVTHKENSKRYGHAHCYVGEPDEATGYVASKLKRHVEVTDIDRPATIDGKASVSYKIKLNIMNPQPEELETLTAKLIEIYDDETKQEFDITLDDTLTVEHTLSTDKPVKDVNFTVEEVA